MSTVASTFDPVLLSLEENTWLLAHVGETWALAGRDIFPKRLPDPSPRDKNPIYYPEGVNPYSVRPVIDRINDLIAIEAATGEAWIGVSAIKTAIETYLAQAKRWQADKRRGAPRFPSLSSYDEKGRPFLSGPGSDAGQVSTYFDSAGNRLKFAVEYVPSGQESWKADWGTKVGAVADQPAAGLVVNPELKRIECFCGETSKYNPDSRQSYNMARARISKHLRSDARKEHVERHRALHQAEFGGGRAS